MCIQTPGRPPVTPGTLGSPCYTHRTSHGKMASRPFGGGGGVIMVNSSRGPLSKQAVMPASAVIGKGVAGQSHSAGATTIEHHDRTPSLTTTTAALKYGWQKRFASTGTHNAIPPTSLHTVTLSASSTPRFACDRTVSREPANSAAGSQPGQVVSGPTFFGSH